MLRALFVLPFVLGVSTGTERKVIVRGNTTDCFSHEIVPVRQVEVSAFNLKSNTDLVAVLRSMDTISFEKDPSSGMSRMESQYEFATQLAHRSTALTRTTSDSTGAFELTINPTDSVVLFAEYDAEDEPFPYAFRVIGGRSDSNVDLDMSRGSCDYIKRSRNTRSNTR